MAVQTNKDQWVKTFGDSIGANSPESNPSGGGTGSSNGLTGGDKYDALEYTSYKDMLSSKIQASVARDQAQKYVGNSLANAGFSGQGMAESTRAGIAGAYNRAIMGADETHQANLMDIASQRVADEETQKTDRWQAAMTMMQEATSVEDLDYLKSEYYDSFTDDQKKMFDYYYSSYSGYLANADSQWADKINETVGLSNGIGYRDILNNKDVKDELNQIEIERGTGSSQKYKDELQNFYTTAKNGDLVQVGQKYLMYYNGKLFYIDNALVGNRRPKISL